MEQRDLIKDQIEQLGRALGKVLADFLGLKANGQVGEGINIANEQLKTELELDVEEISALPADQLTAYFTDKKLRAGHLETLAAYFQELGEHQMLVDAAEARRYLQRSIVLLDTADEISETMSLERMNRKVKIESLLQQL